MPQPEKKESSGDFKIHNVGFYNPAPRQIRCLSYNKKTLKLAVSRDDASIEIWNMRSAVYMERCTLGLPSSSVEGLGWLDNRLFSTGQTGELIEWNLKEMKPKNKVTLTGNAAWCMDIDNVNGCIAVGTNEGYMNTFSVNGDDLNYSKLFDKQEGAIHCCKYDSKGNYIVTGSTDIIRIWNVATGHAMYRMAIGRSEKKKETNVWSLVVLKDLTIIAGDSRGKITVWNGHNGTQIHQLDALEDQVLAVAVNEEETMFCCAGVDPKIRIYVPTKNENDLHRKWILTLKRAVHDHDVKTLTIIDEEKIISGGVDGFINVSDKNKVPKFAKRQYGPFLPQPCAVVAMPSRLLLLKCFNYLEVWRLGRPNDTIQLNDEDQSSRKFLLIDENQDVLYEFRSRRAQPIVCASISPNGTFLIYSTESELRLFQLDTQQKKSPPTKVAVASDKFTACAKVLFSSDSKTMYCVKSSGDIEIFSFCYNDEVDFKATISTKKVIKDTISLVCLSKCEQYFVCAGTCGTVAAWTNKKGRWSFFKTISTPNDYAPTAMAMHNNSCRIVLAYSNYRIFEYDLNQDAVVCTTDSSFKEFLSSKHDNQMKTDTAINTILLDENNDNVVIFQNDSYLFVLEKYKENSKTTKKPKPLLPTQLSSMEYYKLSKKIGNYEHFLHLSWLSLSEIVAINVNPVTLIEQLPPSMRQKQFGNS